MNRRRHPPPPAAFDTTDEAGPGPSSNGQEHPAVNAVGTKCELKQLDGRFNNSGNYVVTDSSVSILTENNADPYDEFAIVSTRVYGADGFYQSTQLEIKSRLLKKALRKVIKYYPSQALDTAEVVFNDPPRPLFHYRKELQEFRDNRADEETKKHLDLLFKFVDSHLGLQMSRFKDYVKRSLVTFNIAWMLFKPGELVYTEKDGIPHIFMIKLIAPIKMMGGKMWRLTLIGTGYNGSRFGRVVETFYINQFEGAKDITALPVFPLSFHKDEAGIKALLLERGNKFVSLRGQHHKQYKGAALVLKESKAISLFDPDDSSGAQDKPKILQTSTVTGRIMIDCETFCRENPGNKISFQDGAETLVCLCEACAAGADPQGNSSGSHQPLPPGVDTMSLPSTKKDHPTIKLCEKDLLMCPPHVLGFSLVNKRWCRFLIDHVSEVQLNTIAFDELQINESHKQLVQAMVEAHIEGNDGFDDIIAGKGKSLIFLLHGPPGVGKTLTAESIADYTKSPLWSISSGELGTDPVIVEENLSKVLEIATLWGAVVLLDEADVFLQQRSGGDVKRNALVSVFLRLLEYYQGILFLTSNRVDSFDLAFKSRIHIALHYPDLTQAIRRRIWSGFIERIPATQREVDLEKDLDILDKEEINGRQIKNACKTSIALARKRGEKLMLKHLMTTLSTVRAFEEDFVKGTSNGQ